MSKSATIKLSDGTRARVGMRVVFVRPPMVVDGLGHACDDTVHEISTVLSWMIGIGPRQTGGKYLRRAPKGSAVTCPDCARWPVYMHWLNRENDMQRVLRTETRDHGFILREWPKSLPERPHGYEVVHINDDFGVLTHAWPTPEEAASELMCVAIGALPRPAVTQPRRR